VGDGSFEFVRDLATGVNETPGNEGYRRHIQQVAIRALGWGRFPEEKALPVLDEVEKKFPKLKYEVTNAREMLKKKQVR
jgi:hypothetical protein